MEGVPFTDITSQREMKVFPKDVAMKIKSDTSERNSNTEVNIKKETLLSNFSIQNEETFSNQEPVSKLVKSNKDIEAETVTLKVKEEQWWLEGNSTEIMKELPLSNFASHKESESFGKHLIMEIKSDTFQRNSDFEMNVTEEQTFLDQHSNLDETEPKIEIKEEEWWLEKNSVKTSSTTYESKDVTTEHFPSIESLRSHMGATTDSTSALFSNEHLGKNVIFNMRTAISECGVFKTDKRVRILKSEMCDIADFPSVESTVRSEQHSYSYNCSLNSDCTKGYNSIHEGKSPYKCDICGKDFIQMSNLKVHKLIHNGNKAHKCDVCGKDFTQLSNLKTHKLIHDGNKAHKCDVCGKHFTRLEHLRHHKLIHEGVKPHKCDVCGKDFTRFSNLRTHKFIHEDIKPHKCDVCGKDFTRYSNLRVHKLIHEGIKPHKCDVCDKDFTLLSHLKKHKFIHERNKTHKCSICGKDYTLFSHLKRHSFIHENKKPHKCAICGKDFTWLSSLKTHSLIHKSKKPHYCDICGKGFIRLSSLRTHTLLHEGIKPHKCDLCGKKFALLYYLNKHKFVHERV